MSQISRPSQIIKAQGGLNAGEPSSFNEDSKIKQNTERRPISLKIDPNHSNVETEGFYIKPSVKIVSLSPLRPRVKRDWSLKWS